MPRYLERSYPYVSALIVAVTFWCCTVSFPAGQDILSASITMGAVFTGFLATLKSIVISLQSRKIEELRKTKFFSLLLSYLQEAIWSSLLFCLCCLCGFFYDPVHPPVFFGVVWSCLAFATLLTFQRVSAILIKVIRVV